MKRRPKGTGCLYRPAGNNIWWFKLSHEGKVCRESTRTDNKTLATEKLKHRLAQLQMGQYDGHKAEQVKLEELADDFLRDYRNNKRKSTTNTWRRWTKHLNPFFAGVRAMNVRASTVQKYIEHRQGQGAAIATINRELAALQRMYRLGIKQEKIYRMPPISMFKENNTRTGFLDDAEYDQLVAVCDKLWLRAILAVAYTYGWRKQELLGLQVSQVDLLNRTIRLNVGETKNDEGRTVAMTQEVYDLLVSCCLGKVPADYVFTRKVKKNGESVDKPIRDFRDDWDELFDKAKLPRKLLHDLRRSAVRNMERAGVPRSVAMKITGHKSESIYRRYAIVDESQMAEAARKIELQRDKSQLGHRLAMPAELAVVESVS